MCSTQRLVKIYNIISKGEDIPEAFAKYFKAKVEEITISTTVDENVFNGTKQINAENEFFMTELRVREVIATLKIKNCEGIDRIPLRILNEGAEILTKPLSKLFKLIYEQKVVPAQWKIAKIIPTHKKVQRTMWPTIAQSLTSVQFQKSMRI